MGKLLSYVSCTLAKDCGLLLLMIHRHDALYYMIYGKTNIHKFNTETVERLLFSTLCIFPCEFMYIKRGRITNDLSQIKSYETNPTNHDNAAQFLRFDIMNGLFVTWRLASIISLGW